MSRFSLPTITLLVLAILVGCGPARQTAPLPEVVLAQALHSPGYAVLYVAEEKGLFKAEGIQVRTLRGGGGAHASMLMATGEVQFAVRSALLSARARAPGSNSMTVQVLSRGVPFQLIVNSQMAKDRDIESQTDLKQRLERIRGLTFATTSRGGAATIFTRYLLESHGIGNQINTVYMGDPQSRKLAFETGQAQLTTGGAENRAYLESGRAVIVADFMRDFPPYREIPHLVLNTSRDWARETPIPVRGIIRALKSAIQFIRDHPAETQAILEAVFEGRYSPGDLAFIMKSQVLPTLPASSEMQEAKWEILAQIERGAGLLEEPVDTSEGILWTNEFLNPDKP